MSNTEIGVFDEEAGGVIGKKMQVPFQMKLLVPSKTTIIECFLLLTTKFPM